MQNTSHAVMAQRVEAADSLDDFPTPPWATRALIEHVVLKTGGLDGQSCLEPACGAGYMARTLSEYFPEVISSDIAYYGYGEVGDFLTSNFDDRKIDWIITNPPFRLAEQFILHSLSIARVGVAILARTVFLESAGRYRSIFSQVPPTYFAQFVERVPMVKGRLDRNATTATGYCWLVWRMKKQDPPRVMWIPPCRRELEKSTDYDLPAQSPRRRTGLLV